MSRPTDAGAIGEAIYAQLEPLAYDDENQGWALLILCGAIGRMLQPVDDLVSDGEDFPGWSVLLDVARCPYAYLPYLAQFVGARIPVGTPEEEARNLVRTPSGFRRGTKESLIAAAQKNLTGNKTVKVVERTSSAYALTVITRTAETPNPAITLQDILSQKPAGLVLTHIVSDLTIIDELGDDIDGLGSGDIDDL